jgi:hypothetical protein
VTRFELLLRGSRDGFGATDFHKRCDNKEATVILVKSTTNHIFGGFAPKSWTSPSSDTWVTDPNAFQFSWDSKEIYLHKYQDETDALCHRTSCGPEFGGVYPGLYIASDCNDNQSSYSFMNSTFTSNGRNLKDITGGVDRDSDGYNMFRVSEYEVFLEVE